MVIRCLAFNDQTEWRRPFPRARPEHSALWPSQPSLLDIPERQPGTVVLIWSRKADYASCWAGLTLAASPTAYAVTATAIGTG